ncbi:hypothetical protein ACROYT_G023503 [Oculina patagonica]
MRHPVRILVIGLLLVLVIASRFLYSSVPENQPIQEINLMAGNLAQQHRHKNIDKKQNSANTLQEKHPISSEKSALAMADPNGSQPKEHESDLSQISLEKSNENKINLKEAKDEKSDNDLNHRKNIPDNERLHKNAGQLSPFESETNDEEVAKRTAFLEEKAFVGDHNKSLKSGKVSKHNGKKAEDRLAANKDRGKISEKKDLKSGSSQQENNILMILAKVGQTSPLAKRFKRCVLSICEHSSIKLTFHIITDTLGKLTCEDTFNQAGKVCKSGLNVTYYDVDKVSKKIEPITKEIQNLFSSSSHSYYNHPLFFVSTAIHHVLPKNMMRIISLDSDLFFKTDIKQLFAMFDTFNSSTIFGLAREQQPVYRHILHMYRDRNPGTKVGEPPPDGLTGFNSGVLLINLHKMRESKMYNHLLHNNVVKQIANKYTFQGHLGDQDFYTLLNLDHPDLFQVLPCSWNRQLCTWWRDNGYAQVFDSYFNCPEPIHVYHGNCGTKMPNE